VFAQANLLHRINFKCKRPLRQHGKYFPLWFLSLVLPKP
jgi:hypothetical protein